MVNVIVALEIGGIDFFFLFTIYIYFVALSWCALPGYIPDMTSCCPDIL